MPRLVGPTETKSRKRLNGDGTTVREFTLTQLVQADNYQQDQQAIEATPGVFRIGNVWTNGTEVSPAICNDVEFQAVEHSLFWLVTSSFSTEADPEDEEDKPPEQIPPRWNWGTTTIQEVMWEDFSDPPRAITNSVGQPLMPTRDVPIAVYTVERFQLTFDPQTIFDFFGHINQNAFGAFPAGHALIAGVGDREAEVNGLDVRQVTWVVKCRPDKRWELKLLDHGTWYWEDAAHTIKKHFAADEGQPVTGNLDGQGGAAADGITAYLGYEEFPQADFAALNLGPFGGP